MSGDTRPVSSRYRVRRHDGSLGQWQTIELALPEPASGAPLGEIAARVKAHAALLRQVNTHVLTMRAAAGAIGELLQLPAAPEPKEPAPARAGRKAIDDTAAHHRMIALMRSEGITIPEAARCVAAESGKAAGQESEAKRLERGLRDRLDRLMDSMDHRKPALGETEPFAAFLGADGFVAFTTEILPIWLRQLASDCETMAGATEAVRQRLAADVETITKDAPAPPVRHRRSPRRE